MSSVHPDSHAGQATALGFGTEHPTTRRVQSPDVALARRAAREQGDPGLTCLRRVATQVPRGRLGSQQSPWLWLVALRGKRRSPRIC